MADLQIGTLASPEMLTAPFEERRHLLTQVEEAGLDHVFVADHISFFNGTGMDGLIQATTIAATVPQLQVVVGVYLLALRHPLPVARQLATFAEAHPGRLIFGVGVGGEDRHEIEICGVDPRTRGRRTDESLAALRGLLIGKSYSHEGDFFDFEDALILPTPSPAIPIVIGGRSEAALRRTAQYGDGWLGVWVSPKAYADRLEKIHEQAEAFGRSDMSWKHGLQIWVGIDDDRSQARARLAKGMENFYKIPFEKFERTSPYGTAEEVAAFLSGFVEEGCKLFNIMPVAETPEKGIEAVATIREILKST